MGEIVGRNVQYVASRCLGQNKCMTGCTRHDVEEGERLVILIDLVARQFAAQDFGKDVVWVVGGHQVLRLLIARGAGRQRRGSLLSKWRKFSEFLAGRSNISALASQEI